jgi:hypothetical protein
VTDEAAIILPVHVDPDLCEPVTRIGRREISVNECPIGFDRRLGAEKQSLILKILYRLEFALKRRRCQTRFSRSVYSKRSSTDTASVVGLFFEKTSETADCPLRVNTTPAASLPAI